VFDSPQSTILPNDAGATYTFRTNDPGQKVTQFYEQALNAMAFEGGSGEGGGSWMISNYSQQWPRDTIVIQEERGGGTERGFRTKIEIVLLHL
jgi:hypothetical protein